MAGLAHAGWGTTRLKQQNNKCGHLDRPHYAKQLCRECYRIQPWFLDRRKQYYQANKQAFHDYYKLCKKQRRKQKYTYGLTEAQWYEMERQQGGVCAICLKPQTPKKLLCVDHDHKTGKVRALLCGKCNGGIGFFNDDVEVMAKAIEYLRAHRSDPV